MCVSINENIIKLNECQFPTHTLEGSYKPEDVMKNIMHKKYLSRERENKQIIGFMHEEEAYISDTEAKEESSLTNKQISNRLDIGCQKYCCEGKQNFLCPIHTNFDKEVELHSNRIEEVDVSEEDFTIENTYCAKKIIVGCMLENNIQFFSNSLYDEAVEEHQTSCFQNIYEYGHFKFSNTIYEEEKTFLDGTSIVPVYEDDLYNRYHYQKE